MRCPSLFNSLISYTFSVLLVNPFRYSCGTEAVVGVGMSSAGAVVVTVTGDPWINWALTYPPVSLNSILYQSPSLPRIFTWSPIFSPPMAP